MAVATQDFLVQLQRTACRQEVQSISAQVFLLNHELERAEVAPDVLKVVQDRLASIREQVDELLPLIP